VWNRVLTRRIHLRFCFGTFVEVEGIDLAPYAAVQADGRNVLADSDLIASATPDPAMEERGTLLPVEWTGRKLIERNPRLAETVVTAKTGQCDEEKRDANIKTADSVPGGRPGAAGVARLGGCWGSAHSASPCTSG
jgi:hypothetical protein